MKSGYKLKSVSLPMLHGCFNEVLCSSILQRGCPGACGWRHLDQRIMGQALGTMDCSSESDPVCTGGTVGTQLVKNEVFHTCADREGGGKSEGGNTSPSQPGREAWVKFP